MFELDRKTILQLIGLLTAMQFLCDDLDLTLRGKISNALDRLYNAH